MTRHRGAAWSATLAVLTAFIVHAAGTPATAAADDRAYVLSNNAIFWIDTGDTNLQGPTIPVTGLNAGDTLVGIDFRPMNGFLYGLGYDDAADTVQLYVISHRTGIATPIGTTGTFVEADGVTPVPIAATAFGVDFDGDRLRVVNDAGHNFRIDPTSGAFVDGDLNTGGALPGLNMDGPINGATTAADALSLRYVLNAATNTVYRMNPLSSGTTSAPFVVTLNGAPLDFTAVNGFDIAALAIAPGHTLGHAVLSVEGQTRLYSVDVDEGDAIAGRTFDVPVQGFALQVDNPIPFPNEPFPNAVPAVALSNNNQLRRFLTVPNPSTTGVGVTGLVAGETLVGIDWRPLTGQLLGLGFDSTNGSGSATLYLVDPSTGAAVIIGSAGSVADGAGNPIGLAGVAAFGFDLDPTTDRIRVVTDTGRNFRINPDDGTVLGGAFDSDQNTLPPGSMGITAAAFTNSYGQTPGGGAATTMYTLDATSDRLLIQSPPDSGTQSVGLPITLNGSPLDFTAANGFDMPPDVTVQTSGAAAQGQSFAVLTVGGLPRLYRIELSTGVATLLGDVGLAGFHGLAVGDRVPGLAFAVLEPFGPPIGTNQPVTLTVSIRPANFPFGATGTFAFTSNGTAIPGCTAQPVVNDDATCTTSFPLPGPYVIDGTYSGDDLNRGNRVSAPTALIVNKAPTTTAVVASPNPQEQSHPVQLTATVTPASATGTITFTVDANPVGTVAVAGGQATLALSTMTIGSHQVAASYSGDDALLGSTSPAITVTIVSVGPRTQYFAEGATGFFDTDIGVLNASATDSANVTVTLFPEGGAPVDVLFTLAPLTRRSVDLAAVVGAVGGVSTLVSADQAIAATRQMTWGSPVYGSTLESGIPATSQAWYFAEGATNVFSLYYLVQNPGASAANVTLTHLLEGGASPVVQNEVVPAFSRRTFYINAVPGLAFASVATAITADVPIVAERAMYLNVTGRLWEGGTAGRGAPALNTTWTLAEGATGFFHTYLLLGNPNGGATTVDVTYQLPDGSTIVKSYEVAGQSRRTVDVNAEDAQLASTAVSMSITSTLPIVVERAMWWGLPPWTEGSAAVASTVTGSVWAIGEGVEGGPNAEATFVLVANASATQGTVRFTIVFDNGARQEKDYPLLGDARLTVRVADEFPTAVGQTFSVLVESLTAAVPITVDVSRYQSADGLLGAGGAAAATRIK